MFGEFKQQIGISRNFFASQNATVASNNTCKAMVKELQDQIVLKLSQREVAFQKCLMQLNSSAIEIPVK